MAMALHFIHLYKLQNAPSAGRFLKHAGRQRVLPECHDTVCYTGQINTISADVGGVLEVCKASLSVRSALLEQSPSPVIHCSYREFCKALQ